MTIIKSAKLIHDENTFEPRIQFEGEISLICYMYDSLPPGKTQDDILMEIGMVIVNEIKEHCQQSKPDYQTWE